MFRAKDSMENPFLMSLRLPRESTLDDDDKELQLDGDHGSGWATWYGNEELLDKDENEEDVVADDEDEEEDDNDVVDDEGNDDEDDGGV